MGDPHGKLGRHKMWLMANLLAKMLELLQMYYFFGAKQCDCFAVSVFAWMYFCFPHPKLIVLLVWRTLWVSAFTWILIHNIDFFLLPGADGYGKHPEEERRGKGFERAEGQGFAEGKLRRCRP